MNTSRLFLIAAFLLVTQFLQAQIVTEERNIEAFSGVSADGSFRVILTQDSIYQLVVEAEEGLLPDIRTRVNRNRLQIDYVGRERNYDRPTIRVKAPFIDGLYASGACHFSANGTINSPSLELEGSGASSFSLDLNTDFLRSKASGATNLRLSGTANTHIFELSGASVLRGLELETALTEAELSGASNAQVMVSEHLKVKASGSSTVLYSGSPLSREFQVSGMARINAYGSETAEQPTSGADTVVVRIGDREITSVSGQGVRVSRPKFARTHFRNNWTGLELGINGYLSPGGNLEMDEDAAFMDLLYNRSIAVNLNLWQQNLPLIWNRLGLYTGLGVGWNNYFFSNNIRLEQGPDQLTHFTDTIYDLRRTKLTVSHLNVPLMLELQTSQSYGPRSFYMAAGVNLGIRLRSHTKQVYDINGNKTKDKNFEHFHLNPFRYEATARIGWGSVRLFASYTLNGMFRENKGPELYPFTVGVTLINF